ncbi:MAG: hypothetical protein EOO77_17460 [Oxalobacteraceae bacterium]|jgi:hypothetical protein|nr:MAG: hypothetical protein EOO77_17460 [Oxalobacteraceae bacterium]
MPRITYPASSPYAATPQSAFSIGRYQHRNIPSSDQDSFFTITEKYNLRPDLLAYDLYGNPNYWWVFCSRNISLIRDPIWDFTTGKVITVPSNTHLKATIG